MKKMKRKAQSNPESIVHYNSLKHFNLQPMSTSHPMKRKKRKPEARLRMNHQTKETQNYLLMKILNIQRQTYHRKKNLKKRRPPLNTRAEKNTKGFGICHNPPQEKNKIQI